MKSVDNRLFGRVAKLVGELEAATVDDIISNLLRAYPEYRRQKQDILRRATSAAMKQLEENEAKSNTPPNSVCIRVLAVIFL